MTPSPEELEKQVHRLLRSLPDRPAPARLEARVLTRIRPMETQAWWRRPYSGWPVALRLAFLVGSAAAAAVVIVAFSRLSLASPVAGAANAGGELAATLRAFCADLTAVAAALLRHVPAGWIYGGLAAIAAAYAMLVGIGSVFYRTLVRPSPSP